MRGNPWEKTRQTIHSHCNFLYCSLAERYQTAFRLHTSCLLALPVFPWSLTPPQHPPPPSSSVQRWCFQHGFWEMEVVKTSRLALQKEETNKRGAESCLKPVERKERERKRWQRLRKLWSSGSAAPWRAGRGFLGKGGEILVVRSERASEEKREREA